MLSRAAMLLAFDIVPEQIAEHDDWHTHEHLPERLAIPGFLRGSRWTAIRGQPRYFAMYEVERLETLGSDAYLERLNNPSAWTSKMMPHYRGMTRGLCSVAGTAGYGTGNVGLLCRFSPAPGAESRLADWIARDILGPLPTRPGLGSVHWFKSALAPKMTSEQRIRGADAGIDWAVLATGYDQDAVDALARSELSDAQLEARGATRVVSALYRTGYTLTASELRG